MLCNTLFKHITIILTDEYRFTTCNMQGPLGPHKTDCDKVYKYYRTQVSIGDNEDNIEHPEMKHEDGFSQFGYVTGIQRWRVPKTGIYT